MCKRIRSYLLQGNLACPHQANPVWKKTGVTGTRFCDALITTQTTSAGSFLHHTHKPLFGNFKYTQCPKSEPTRSINLYGSMLN